MGGHLLYCALLLYCTFAALALWEQGAKLGLDLVELLDEARAIRDRVGIVIVDELVSQRYEESHLLDGMLGYPSAVRHACHRDLVV